MAYKAIHNLVHTYCCNFNLHHANPLALFALDLLYISQASQGLFMQDFCTCYFLGLEDYFLPIAWLSSSHNSSLNSNHVSIEKPALATILKVILTTLLYGLHHSPLLFIYLQCMYFLC